MSSHVDRPVDTVVANVLQGLFTRLNDDSDLLKARTELLQQAFIEIEKQIVGSNTNESIVLARNQITNLSRERTPLDLSTFALSNKSLADFQKWSTVITEHTSYSLDVLTRLIKELRDTDTLRNIQVQNMTAQPQVVIEQEQGGLMDRLHNFFSGFRSQRDKDFEHAIQLFEGKLRETQAAMERWRVWKQQHIEFLEYAVFFSKNGNDINHMYAAVLTEIRTFYLMQEYVVPVVMSGLRFNAQDFQKTFASTANTMAQALTQQQNTNRQLP